MQAWPCLGAHIQLACSAAPATWQPPRLLRFCLLWTWLLLLKCLTSVWLLAFWLGIIVRLRCACIARP